MTGSVLNYTLGYGYAGEPSHTPDNINATHPVALTETDGIVFGAACVQNTDGSIANFGATNVAADFAGVAVRVVKTPVSYPDQNLGKYLAGEIMTLCERGAITIQLNEGFNTDPVIGGTVYVRVALNTTDYPDAIIGGFETTADSTNTVALTNAVFSSTADANGVAEITILTRQAV